MAKKKRNPKNFWEQHQKDKKQGVDKKDEGSKPKKRPVITRRPPKNEEKPDRKPKGPPTEPDAAERIRLNRFIAQAGVCSRREADKLIAEGKIRVNGKIITELGAKVLPEKDKVEYMGKLLTAEQFVYILFNKPKNTITTTKDPLGRNTVLDAIQKATDQRVFPVGRLDRNTTGLLLLTNDGALTKKLTHPSHKVKKLYYVKLDREFEEEDLDKLVKGVELEDGMAKADKADYVLHAPLNEVGVEIHIGRNRVVRRMFQALGYNVVALDRVMIAHLTKKNLPRGKWRKLTDKEVSFLKMI